MVAKFTEGRSHPEALSRYNIGGDGGSGIVHLWPLLGGGEGT